MPISFVEAMRGWLRVDGAEHPISFEVHALGQGGGKFELRGLLSAPPLGVDRPARGTLVIAPLRRSLAYDLEFTSSEGARYALKAEKHPSLLAPLQSMTCMLATVRDANGTLVGEGEMRFDLRDLAPFAASWLPLPRTAQRQLDARRRQIERRLLAEGT